MSAGGCFLLSLESPPQEEMYSKGQKKNPCDGKNLWVFYVSRTFTNTFLNTFLRNKGCKDAPPPPPPVTLRLVSLLSTDHAHV